jgi:hypothetical protein
MMERLYTPDNLKATFSGIDNSLYLSPERDIRLGSGVPPTKIAAAICPLSKAAHNTLTGRKFCNVAEVQLGSQDSGSDVAAAGGAYGKPGKVCRCIECLVTQAELP